MPVLLLLTVEAAAMEMVTEESENLSGGGMAPAPPAGLDEVPE